MVYVIISIVVIVFVISIICLVKVVSRNVTRTRKDSYKVISVIPLMGKCDDVEYRVRSVIWGDTWNDICVHKIVLAVGNCDEDTKKICSKLSEEYQCVEVCDIAKINSFIMSE